MIRIDVSWALLLLLAVLFGALFWFLAAYGAGHLAGWW